MNWFWRGADGLCHAVHLTVIGFMLAGCWFPATRGAHLLLALAILVSWYGLGLIHGPGYCLFTDWHWRLKVRQGQRRPEASYLGWWVNRLGWAIPESRIHRLAAAIFFLLLLGSIALNFRA